MSVEVQEGTYKRGYRIYLLWQWAKASNCRDPGQIANHALIRFVCSEKTAMQYAKEVLLRLNMEDSNNAEG